MKVETNQYTEIESADAHIEDVYRRIYSEENKMKDGRGGYRKGGGRPKGSKDTYQRKAKPASPYRVENKDIPVGTRVIALKPPKVGITYLDGRERMVTGEEAEMILENDVA